MKNDFVVGAISVVETWTVFADSQSSFSLQSALNTLPADVVDSIVLDVFEQLHSGGHSGFSQSQDNSVVVESSSVVVVEVVVVVVDEVVVDVVVVDVVSVDAVLVTMVVVDVVVGIFVWQSHSGGHSGSSQLQI